MPAPIGPGGAYEVSFRATPGGHLSFATLLVPSNDFFFAPDTARAAFLRYTEGKSVSAVWRPVTSPLRPRSMHHLGYGISAQWKGAHHAKSRT